MPHISHFKHFSRSTVYNKQLARYGLQDLRALKQVFHCVQFFNTRTNTFLRNYDEHSSAVHTEGVFK